MLYTHQIIQICEFIQEKGLEDELIKFIEKDDKEEVREYFKFLKGCVIKKNNSRDIFRS